MRSKYWSAIKEEMEELGRWKNTIFLGQQVLSEDFYGTLRDVDKSKRVEMPVAEDMQMGLATGLALEGYLPICIFQRMDFLPRACDQIVNHLDKIRELSRETFNPKVIIRTTVGTKKPLDVGLQHSQDLTEGFKHLVDFTIIPVRTVEEVRDAYKRARECESPIMIVEFQELYGN